MSEVIDIVLVGDEDGDLVALVHLEGLEAEGGRDRVHVDAHLVAVANHVLAPVEIDAVFRCPLACLFPGRIVAVPDLLRVHLGPMNHDAVVGLGEGGAVMDQLHLVTRNVDELLAFGLERTHIDEPVLRELVERDQPLAVRLLGLAHRGVVVPRLVVHVDLIDDRVHLLAVVLTDRVLQAPLADLAVEEERGEAIAAPVEGGVERPEAELGLGDDHVARRDLVREQVIEAAHVDDRDGRRELAVDDDVDAVGRRVDAVGAGRDRDVAGVGRALAAVEHLDAAVHRVVAVLHPLLDAGDVEDDGPVLLGGGHLLQVHAHLGVVAGGDRVLALIVGIDVVEVAVDDDLPGYLHRVAVERREDRDVLRRIIEHGAVVGERNLVLAVAEHVAGARIFLRPQAVDVIGVGNLHDLVDLHHVAANPGDARIRLVVDPEIASVVRAVGKRHVRVVRVAIGVDAAAGFEKLPGLWCEPFGHDLAALVGEPPARGAAAVEHRDAEELTHGGDAKDAHLAGLAARPKAIVFVELAGRHVGGACLSRGVRLARRVGGGYPGDSGGDHPADGGDLRRGADQLAAGDAGLLRCIVFLLRHGFLLIAWHQGLVAVPDGPAGAAGGIVMLVEARARRRSRLRRRWIIGGQRCSSW